MLKAVTYDSGELAFSKHFSSGELREDPKNHSVPLLDVVYIPEDSWWEADGYPLNVVMVMPLLHPIDTPPFHCRLEVIEAFRQLLEVSALSHCLRLVTL